MHTYIYQVGTWVAVTIGNAASIKVLGYESFSFFHLDFWQIKDKPIHTLPYRPQSQLHK